MSALRDLRLLSEDLRRELPDIKPSTRRATIKNLVSYGYVQAEVVTDKIFIYSLTPMGYQRLANHGSPDDDDQDDDEALFEPNVKQRVGDFGGQRASSVWELGATS